MGSEITERQYAKRDIETQGEHYMRHLDALTVENLRSKSGIAAELAHRDMQIAELRSALSASQTKQAKEDERISLLRGWAQLAKGEDIDLRGAFETNAEEAERLTEIRWQEQIDKIVRQFYPERDGSGSDGDALALTLSEIGQAFRHLEEKASASQAECGRLRALRHKWRNQAAASREEAARIHGTLHSLTAAEDRCLARAEVWDKCAEEVGQ